MKKRLSREFKVGAFGVCIVLLLYFGINFIKSNRIFSSDKTYYAVFDAADGIEPSAPVLTKGFRIGTVEKVTFDLNSQRFIVEMSVQKEYPIPGGSKAKIASSSLLGSKVMEVAFGQDKSHPIPNQDTIPSSVEPSIMDMVSQEYSSIKDKLRDYSVKVDSALTGLQIAMSRENMDNLSKTFANIEGISGDLKEVVEAKKKNIESMLSNLDAISSDLKAMSPKLNRTIGNFEAASDSLPLVMMKIAGAVDNVSSILKKVESGEGNLGKLVHDDQLYANLTESLKSLELLISDLKENPKKYINVVVFPRKEKAPKSVK